MLNPTIPTEMLPARNPWYDSASCSGDGHVGFDDEIGDLDAAQVLDLLEHPLARLPGARRRHVLACGVAGFVSEVDVHHAADDVRLDGHEARVARYQANLFTELVDMVANPVRERESALHVRDREQRDAHHSLADDAGGHAAGARHRRCAATA
jgi:hypothetical protein